MNTDTPETDYAARHIDGFADQWVPRYVSEELERERDELRAQLRDEQQLHVKTLDERDEARGTSWFLNGAEYRKRNDYIEARNNLNPHWVVVDSQTNQKP